MNFSVFRDAVRAKEIVSILIKYRFDELLANTDTPAAWLSKIVPAVKGNTSVWRRIRMAIEELGPTFIKIGQVLSTRPDILPRELIVELENLHDQVNPVEFEKIKPLIEKEMGGALENFFSQFNQKPKAAASIGQVYQATLKSENTQVAVKVRRPNIRKPIQIDMEILDWLADQLHQNIDALKPFDLPSVVEELRKGILNELNFENEARNAEVFNSLNQYPDKVYAPKVYPELSSSMILITEWIEGVKPANSNQLENDLRKKIAKSGGESFFSQIVITGFFHGDPHPGNLLISKDNRLCILDWGIVGQLTHKMRYALIDLFSAAAKRDARLVSKIAVSMSSSTHRINKISLEKEITTVLFKHDASLKKMENIGEVIFELIFVFGSNGIHVARDYTLLAKAIISIEKTSGLLDPEFNLARIGQPFIRQLNWERWNPTNFTRYAMFDWGERLRKFSEIPADIQRLIHRIEDEDMPIVIRHKGFSEASNTIHHAFSRLSLAIIIGSLIVGSSLLINTGMKPLLWGYPALGITGYLLSAAIGAYVTFDILRSGSKKQ